MSFKIKIRKTCKICKKPITRNRFRTFCSKSCRLKSNYNKHYKKQVKWRRERDDKAASIPSKDKIQCCICGRWYKQVGSHVFLRHKMLARDYRKQYGFDLKKGQLPDWLKKIKHDHVFKNGTVENLKSGKDNQFKKGQHGLGVYERSSQTLDRLNKLHTFNNH